MFILRKVFIQQKQGPFSADGSYRVAEEKAEVVAKCGRLANQDTH